MVDEQPFNVAWTQSLSAGGQRKKPWDGSMLNHCSLPNTPISIISPFRYFSMSRVSEKEGAF